MYWSFYPTQVVPLSSIPYLLVDDIYLFKGPGMELSNTLDIRVHVICSLNLHETRVSDTIWSAGSVSSA
jgi:hypothetical protein